MRTKFTKASKKDKTLVTLNLAQFNLFEDTSGTGQWSSISYTIESQCPFEAERSNLRVGDVLLVTIDGNQVPFTVNRVRKGMATTAVTHCFPRYLRLPQVGRPVYADTTEIT